jgi:hypothetical protein
MTVHCALPSALPSVSPSALRRPFLGVQEAKAAFAQSKARAHDNLRKFVAVHHGEAGEAEAGEPPQSKL